MSHNIISVNSAEPDRIGDITSTLGSIEGNIVSLVSHSSSGNSVSVGDYAMIIFDIYCRNYENTIYVQENAAGSTSPKSNANFSGSWTLKVAGYYWFECVFAVAGLSTSEEFDLQLKDGAGNALGPKSIYRGNNNTYRLATTVTGLFYVAANTTVHAEFTRLVGSCTMPTTQQYFPYLEVRYLGGT